MGHRPGVVKDGSRSFHVRIDFSLQSSASRSTVPLTCLSAAPSVGLRDEKECRKCEAWPNLESDGARAGGGVVVGCWRNGGQQVRPLDCQTLECRAGYQLSSDTQNPDLRLCFHPPKYA